MFNQGCRSLRLRIAALTVLMFGALTAWSSPVTVAEEDGVLHLRNDYLERTLQFGNGTVHTTSLRNNISGHIYTISGDEFRVKSIFERWKQDSENP